MIQQAPRHLGLDRSRWWLAGLQAVIPWLKTCSLATVSKTLKHFRLRYKRGRESLHSPDPAYALKLAYVEAAKAQAQADPVGCVVLYQDELTYYRRPSLSYDYAPSPSKRPAAPAGHTSNKVRRIAGSLDVRTGQFLAMQRRRFDRHALLRYYRQLEAAYPEATRIFIVQDNWPVHFHPDILLALANTKIMLLRLPTYAPWTNPVEKVWRKLKQECLHLHDFADDWLGLQQAVQNWLDLANVHSNDLLRYVGLLPI